MTPPTKIFEFDGIFLSGSGYYLFLINIGANDVFTALFSSDYAFSVSPKNSCPTSSNVRNISAGDVDT